MLETWVIGFTLRLIFRPKIEVTPAIPVIAAQFNSSSSYTWIGSAYLLTSAAFLPSWGNFSDIWGRKKVLLVAAIIFMVGSILCAVALNIEVLLVGRAIQGLGAGGQLGLVNVVIADLVPVRDRGVYLSYIGLTWAFASAIGPVLGGAFAEKIWRLCFWINIPIAVIAIPGLYFFLHLQIPQIGLWDGLKRVDWIGTFLIVLGTVLFLLGLEFGGVSHPWDSPIVLCFLVLGVALMAAFIIVEWKVAQSPIMPLRLFSNVTSVCSCLVGFFHGFIFISGSYFLPLFFQAVRGDSPLMAGILILPYAVILSIVSGFVGFIIKKTGRYQEMIWIGLIIMVLGVGLLIDLDRESNWGKLIMYQTLVGIGCGPIFQAPLIAIHATIEQKDVGTATTTFFFIRSLGTALAISIGLVVFQNAMQRQSADLYGVLSPEVAIAISGQSASASVGFIQKLQGPERYIAQDAYAKGLQAMWYFFLAISICCLISSFGIGRHHLSKRINSVQPVMDQPRKTKKARNEAEV